MSDCNRTCSGHCCERFCLPFSPEEGWRSYRYAAHLSQGGSAIPKQLRYRDIEVLMPMLTYLGMHPWDPATGKLAPGMLHHYTCRSFDTTHRLCKIYEHRPHVCQVFPDTAGCQYPDCTWAEKRADRPLRLGPENLVIPECMKKKSA